jgi:cytochrome c553
MTLKLIATIFIASIAISGAAQAAGDAAAGAAKAPICAACHGDKGQGVPPNPSLAGKPEAELVKDLKDFKSGARSNPLMSPMAALLNDQDVENMAAYYSSLK